MFGKRRGAIAKEISVKQRKEATNARGNKRNLRWDIKMSGYSGNLEVLDKERLQSKCYKMCQICANSYGGH